MVFEIAVHVATLASVLLFYRERVIELVRGVLDAAPRGAALRRQARARDAAGGGRRAGLRRLPRVAVRVRPRGVDRPARHGRGAVDHAADASPRRAWPSRAGARRSGWAARRRSRSCPASRAAASRSRPRSRSACADGGGGVLVPDERRGDLGRRRLDASRAAGVAARAPRSAWRSAPPTALVSGIGAIWFCIRLLRRGSLHWFAYYTWAAGLAMLAVAARARRRLRTASEARSEPQASGVGGAGMPAPDPSYGSRIGCRLCAGIVSRSFFSARASSWRTRSRERPSDCPICSSVCSSSPPRP